MKWFKKHADTLTIIALILGGFVWGDGKFDKVNDRLSHVERELGEVKTVLIIRGMMPESMAVGE